MAKRWLTSWLFVLLAIGCTVGQADLAAKAVPDQNDGKDYAGRPVQNAPVPQAPTLNPEQKQTVEQSVRDISLRLRPFRYHFGAESSPPGRCRVAESTSE